MTANTIVPVIVEALCILVALIPIVAKLVSTVKELVEERNWKKLVEVVIDYCKQAETLLGNGTERRKWVITMVRNYADKIGFEITDEEIGEIIDAIIDATNSINIYPNNNNNINSPDKDEHK